ncbi:type IV pilin [Halomarina oriensis]|uniref:Type IV pilin n=1 Tax=Halomarina oriensis TaxID=671145 RepID=A0A6B0GTA9_9EURY|nr:type IV pilin [Halomarina oriensis]
MDSRAQSHVVGVVLLVGITVVALGTLTATVGTVVEQNAATADADRVATDVDAALDPVEATGRNRGRVSFTDGQLHTESRDLRLLDETGVVQRVRVDALVFEAGRNRVAFVGGAIVRGRPGSASLRDPPLVTASRDGDGGVLVVGAATLGEPNAVGGEQVSLTLATDVSHDRTSHGDGHYRVAIETATPGAFERWFAERGVSTERRDIDDDGVESVVATYEGRRTAYLVVHHLNTEVET